MKRFPVAHPARLTLVAVAVSLAGCSTVEGWFSSDKAPYEEKKVESKPLEVPPDLSQLARDNRYSREGGVISAANSPGLAGVAGGATPATAGPSAALPAAGVAVAPTSLAGMHIERDGQRRWLVTPLTPEQIWPQLKTFWDKNGFKLASENAESGVMETDWHEDRSKLPNDFIRRTIGKVFDRLYDTGLRDRFRVTVERTPTGCEVYITHRGLEQVYTDAQKTIVDWRPRAEDPQLESQYLNLLMAQLAPAQPVAVTAAATAAPAASAAPAGPMHARATGGAGGAALEVDEPFDRAWRRVGLALDRNGYTVEDRDRAAGLYYIRYVDPKYADQEEPGFFARLFGAKSGRSSPVRYRLKLSGSGDTTQVAVLDSAGNPVAGENPTRIVEQLVRDLQ